MRGPQRSGLVYSTLASILGGLALLTVDLHEVGDLLALTNILVQLHNTKREAPKRHLTNIGGTNLQKIIDVVDQCTPCSCASKDSLLNTKSLSHRIGMGRRD